MAILSENKMQKIPTDLHFFFQVLIPERNYFFHFGLIYVCDYYLCLDNYFPYKLQSFFCVKGRYLLLKAKGNCSGSIDR